MPNAEFYSTCAPVLFAAGDYPSLSKFDLDSVTPKKLEEWLTLGHEEAAFLYRNMMLAGLSGVHDRNFAELLLSRAQTPDPQSNFPPLEKKNLGQGRSFLQPYSMVEIENIVNANAFRIVGGEVNSDAGQSDPTVPDGAFHAGSYIITVRNTESPFGSPLKQIERYFLIGEHVIVLNLSATGAAQQPVFMIEKVENDDQGSIAQCKVFIRPLLTNTAFNALDDTTEKPLYRPEAGVVQIGANSVSDFESWCQNQPAEISRRIKEYWPQTSRFVRRWDDEYEKLISQIFAGKLSVALEKFRALPMTQANKMMYANYLRKWVNSILYGLPISEHQTVEGYKNLPQIRDPRTNTFLEYKSNAVGLYPQLNNCGRVYDMVGQTLDFNWIEEWIYTLRRYREGRSGNTVQDIDVFVDRHNFSRLRSMFGNYYRKKYGTSWERSFGPTDPIVHPSDKQRVLWEKASYELPEAGVMLHVYMENALSDSRLHFPAGMRQRGNFMWFLDIKDITLGIYETNSRRSHTPDIDTDPEFQCRIKANVTHTDMESTKWTVMVGDENVHGVFVNFSDDCPRYAAQVCPAIEFSNSEPSASASESSSSASA